MNDRVVLGVAMLIAGVLCVGVTLVATAWVDVVAKHERSAEIHCAIQVELQGKTLANVAPQPSLLSPLMIWLTFGIGAYIMAAGFVIGIRGLTLGRATSGQSV